MVQPGREEDRIIPLVNQPVPSPSPRPFHAKCGRTATPREDQFCIHTLPPFAYLQLQRLDPFALVRGRPSILASSPLVLANLLAQRLASANDFFRD